MKPHYYNENNPFMAQWLRRLITAGELPAGDVDERSITEVRGEDLAPYVQCHFFAGLGAWALALKQAGWPTDREVWTGSCPCQPFSSAGKGEGFDDERHLWPIWRDLIEERAPAAVFGEQVASHHAKAWIDLVQADMESLGYPFAAVPFPAGGIGAPNLRLRAFWVAYADQERRDGSRDAGLALRSGIGGTETSRCASLADGLADPGICGDQCESAASEAGAALNGSPGQLSGCGRASGELADSDGDRCAALSSGRLQADHQHDAQSLGDARSVADPVVQQRSHGQPAVSLEYDARGRVEGAAAAAGLRLDRTLEHTERDGCDPSGHDHREHDGLELSPTGQVAEGSPAPGPVNGFWADADWLYCRDNRWRPVEPGTFPLAHGLPRSLAKASPELQRLASLAELDEKSLARAKSHRVGTLRGYGNAINVEQARLFIVSSMEILKEIS